MSRSSQAIGSGGEPIPNLQLRLFGPLSVRVEGAPLPPLHSRKGAWLLALLVLKHQRPVDRRWLAATLWPDSDHPESLRNLRNTLSDLRRALGPQEKRIHSPTPGTLRLNLAEADVDLTAFDAGVKRGDPESLAKAVALYRGPLLEGCEEEWVVLERQQRQQACLAALETLAHSALQTGQPAEAARCLRTGIGIDPFRETAQCTLMSALAATGDFAGVTQVFREFRLLLHEQLHTQPAAETLTLYQKIRVRARQVAAGCAPPLAAATLPRPPSDLPADTSLEESKDLAACSVPSNLPPPLTSFIGREKERAEVKAMLEQSRLLTLTGAGGSGKTRLSLEVAGEEAASYPDGVWLVELAALSDPALVVQAAATALNVREQPGAPLLHTLVSALKSRTLLLLLDNCEHLLAACAELAAALLRGCPAVQLLAASRERLGIAGEQIYRVPSLSLPDLNAPVSVESLRGYESVRLFVARACLIRSEFRVSPQNARAVAQVCHRLDGIPLAIELAAARVRSLSVEELQRRLDDRFDLLTGGDRSALPRQQTLRGLIDWSYNLLNAHETALLNRLSVFAGGWTLEAAEQICSDFGFWILDFRLSSAPSEGATSGSESDQRNKLGARKQIPNETSAVRNPKSEIQNEEVLDLLTSLVDKSLVLCEEREGAIRYRLLETMRQYARERLMESGESDEARRCHRDYFLALAEEIKPKLTGAEQVRWMTVLETEHDNLRQALTFCEEESDGGEEGLRLAAALQTFWHIRGHLSEGRDRLAALMSRPGAQGRTGARAGACNTAGWLALTQGDYGAARAQLEESLALSRELGDRRGIAGSLNNLGSAVMKQGDFAAARSLFEDALSLNRELGNRTWEAINLGELGSMAFQQGDYVTARSLLEDALRLHRERGNRAGEAANLNILGNVALQQGDSVAARSLYHNALRLNRELGNRAGEAFDLANLGAVAYFQGDYAAARSLYEDTLNLNRELGKRAEEAHSLGCLGTLAYHRGDYAAAHSLQVTGLTIWREVGDRRGVVMSLGNFASLAVAKEHWQHAACLYGAADALRQRIGAPLPPKNQHGFDQEVAQIRSALGEAAFDAAWKEGRAMTWEQAVVFALGETQESDPTGNS